MHFLFYSNEVSGIFHSKKVLKLLLIMNKNLELQDVAENQKM